MIEDKIKQEYEWQHREIGQPTLDELFSKINEALGIELWIWQKTYMTMGTYRQMGQPQLNVCGYCFLAKRHR